VLFTPTQQLSENQIIHGSVTAISMSNLGADHHLGFVQKWIFTILRPSETHQYINTIGAFAAELHMI